MASDNNSAIRKIPDSASSSEILSILNDNFRILTQRIKDVNMSVSYFDLLKLTNIWTAPYQDPEQNLNNFLASCWNILANYSAVYINDERVGVDYAFILNGDTICNGDFVVRLPNGQHLRIPAAGVKYYQPTAYNGSVLTYTLVSGQPVSNEITLQTPQIVNDGYTVVTNPTIPISGTIKDVRWFAANGEEIFWNGSSTSSTCAAGATALLASWTCLLKSE